MHIAHVEVVSCVSFVYSVLSTRLVSERPSASVRLQLSNQCCHFLPSVHLNSAGHHQLCFGLAAKCEQTFLFFCTM